MKYLSVLISILIALVSACSWSSATPTSSPIPDRPAVSTAVPTTSAALSQIDTPSPQLATATPSTPALIAQLQATVMRELPPTPTPDASGLPRTPLEVKVLPLETGFNSQALWAVSTEGPVDLPVHHHFVAIYTYGNKGWQELDRLELERPFWVSLVSQVDLEPSRIWLEVKGQAGMRPASYDLLSFDGHFLRNETYQFIGGMGNGQLMDVNGDGQPEVVLDQNLGYGILCGICGTYRLEFQLLRWNGSTLEEMKLRTLLPSSRTRVRDLNNQAIKLAQADLWKDAQVVIKQARELEPEEATVAWNAGLIDLYAKARADHVSESDYPLLAKIFYGDYEAALELVRPYNPEEIFNARTPLVIGTIAEYTAESLSDEISISTTRAIRAKPDLAAAYFLRGWASYLIYPDNTQILADLQQAVELDPDETLFQQSLISVQNTTDFEQKENEHQQDLIPTPVLTLAARSGFSLNLGNTWIYSSTHYRTLMNSAGVKESITATYIVTVTVAEVQENAPYFAAKIAEDASLIAPSLPSEHWNSFSGEKQRTYWYIVNGPHIYYSEEETLDFSKIESSSLLMYNFPLSYADKWYPNYDDKEEDFGSVLTLLFSRGPVQVKTPAGNFAGCYEITDIMVGGVKKEWVCPGTGVVEIEEGLKNLLPSGYRKILVDYKLENP